MLKQFLTGSRLSIWDLMACLSEGASMVSTTVWVLVRWRELDYNECEVFSELTGCICFFLLVCVFYCVAANDNSDWR